MAVRRSNGVLLLLVCMLTIAVMFLDAKAREKNGTVKSAVENKKYPTTNSGQQELMGLKERTRIDSLPAGFGRVRWANEFSIQDSTSSISKWSNGFNVDKTKYEFIMGISTIKREGVDYLPNTLRSLLFNDNTGDHKFTVIVLIAEEDEEYIQNKTSQLCNDFKIECTDKIIQIITPPRNFYPDWSTSLRQNFGDPFERVKWRSKQNLDQMLLLSYVGMMNGEYYMMLEDDIIASKGYLDSIAKHIAKLETGDWLMSSYCGLGAIGKLIPRDLVSSITSYIGLFWNDKPLDWLLTDYVKTRVCGMDDSEKSCEKIKVAKTYVHYSPSLFQHKGKISSLKGKIQKLKDKSFGKH